MNSAYRGESGKRSWSTEAHFIDGQRIDSERVRELIACPDTLLLLAKGEDGALIGCVELLLEWLAAAIKIRYSRDSRAWIALIPHTN